LGFFCFVVVVILRANLFQRRSLFLSLSLPVKNVVVLFLKQKEKESQKRSFKKNPKTKKLF